MSPEIPIETFEIFATGIDHPECLAFDRNRDLWAGGEAGQIYRISPESSVQLITSMGGFCGGLAFSLKDELFVCNPTLGIVRVESSGKFSVFATHAANHKLICPNYGLFDPDGNYYVTDSGNWKKNNGYLLRFTPSGSGQILAGPFGYANGLALSADERFLFMVESNTDSVFRFEIRGDGSLGPTELYASDEIWRISPARQKSLFAWDRWAILLGSPTNMAFGGKNLDELYVANLARTTITRAKVKRKGQPLVNQR